MMDSLLMVPGALVAITLLVVVHESGHFLVAKLLRVGVLVFSLGFGQRLFGFQWRGTDYRVSALPFGGYVRMSHADPFGDAGLMVDDEDLTPRARWFSLRPAWQRLAIMFGGPGANLVFPVFLFTLLFMGGEPQSESVIGNVVPGSLAFEAGARAGDRIVAVGGTEVASWEAVSRAIGKDPTEVSLTLARGDERLLVTLPVEDQRRPLGGTGIESVASAAAVGVDHPGSPAARAGLRTGMIIRKVDGVEVPDFRRLSSALLLAGPSVVLETEDATYTLHRDPAWPPAVGAGDGAVWQRWGVEDAALFVASTWEDSAAAEAGVQKGDRLLEVDGVPIRRFGDLQKVVQRAAEDAAAPRAVRLAVRRAGEEVGFELAPRVQEYVGDDGAYRRDVLLGIRASGALVGPPEIVIHHPPVRAFVRAVISTGGSVTAILERLGQMVSREAPVLDNLGGPVAMVTQATQAAQRGMFELGTMVAFLSISLAVLNLLPIPVLDGGSILMYAAEWIRGRPLPRVIQERSLQVGVVFLAMLTLVVFVKDVLQLVDLLRADP